LAVFTDAHGEFALTVPANVELTLGFSVVSYEPAVHAIRLSPGERIDLRIELTPKMLKVVTITPGEDRKPISIVVLEPLKLEEFPVPGQFEYLVKSIGLGVGTSGGELSSQYSVRGGNFDENLIYVNDFEVYRPLLIRGGQQEGLSFINSKLVRDISFSSGGFEAKYGDKMSSVLEVKYRRPDTLGATAELSPLGVSLHFESVNKHNTWMYLVGARQRSSRYLLTSLETKGAYSPSSYDVQSLIIHRFVRKSDSVQQVYASRWEMEWLTNVSRNQYRFIPEDLISSIGTIDNVKQLEVFFEGSERDRFETYMSGLSATYIGDSNRTRLKFLASAYRSNETETFDIIGDYFLYQVETNLGEEEFGERLFGLGYGTYHDFARNYLTATVANVEHKGYRLGEKHFFEWGARYQLEDVDDRLNEWVRQDSALYSLPNDPDSVFVYGYVKGDTSLTSNRLSAYLQDTWVLRQDAQSATNLTYGVRAQWWDVNQELLVSPRVQLSIKPPWRRDVIFKAAAGLYQQPPFYRELRDLNGNLNTALHAQKSLHLVTGLDCVFMLWDREFRFITEAYYKRLWDLVPYDVEDVKIRYFAENSAIGYATGIDFRLNGEFIEDAESWMTLSFLRTREDIAGDFYTVYLDSAGNEVFPGTSAFDHVADTVIRELGSIPRPTDQLVKFSILFTDYLPKNKNFKVSLNLIFGSSLPFSPPQTVRYRNTFRMSPYRRVDIGFSALLWDEDRKAEHPASPFRKFSKIWASLEVFNLLGIKNTISHIWISDNNGTSYAFENHLTGRLLNLRAIVRL
jgi:hypothetical protein